MISVVIATCDRAPLLVQSVRSVLSQDYAGQFEIIIVDQGNPGALQRSLDQEFAADPRIRYFHVSRAGASAARNFGLKEACGDAIAFLDDDAIAEPDWLTAIERVFATYPDTGIVAGRIRPAWDAPPPSWMPASRRFLLGLYDLGDMGAILPHHDQPIGANMALRKNLVAAAGGFPEELGPSRFHRCPMLTGEESLLSIRLRDSGVCARYEPGVSALHVISRVKLTRAYYLKRHFWEGVTRIEQKRLLGYLTGQRKMEFWRIVIGFAAAAGEWLVPGRFGSSGQHSSAALMLAAGRFADLLGALAASTVYRRGCR